MEGRRPLGGPRWRYFSSAPLIEDDSVRSRSSSLINGRLGYAFANGLHLELEAFNLLDSKASDIQCYYTSRLPGEPAEGVADIHSHPMEKRAHSGESLLVSSQRLPS